MKHILLTTIAAVVLVGCNHIKPFDETKSVTPSRDAWRRANAGSHPSQPRLSCNKSHQTYFELRRPIS